MTERRLAAILVAHVVGYSTLVGGDEAGTLAKFAAMKREVISSCPGVVEYADLRALLLPQCFHGAMAAESRKAKAR